MTGGESKPPSQDGFENILNFRDVGATINTFTGTSKLKTGLFFRSARPDEASPHDRDLLRETYKIRTIIDLRTKSEHIQQAEKRAAATATAAPTMPTAEPFAPSNDEAADPLKIPGIDYAEINFNGSAYSRSLLKQLRYWSLARFLALIAWGRRIEAIAILGSEVMVHRGLVGLAIDSLAVCTAEVFEVFDVLAAEGKWPVVVHCTQGKDRTGLVVLLVLMLLGVDMEAIERDYRLTQGELVREREERLVEIRAIGLPDSFADCPNDWIEKVSAFVNEEYGGVEKYLLKCGVTEDMQQRVRETLLA